MAVTGPSPSLLDLLCNSVVLFQLAPYLPLTAVLALKSTSKSYRHVLSSALETHRYLDLSRCKAAIVPDMSVDHGGVNWRNERMDESLTEDDIYCGPLRGIFAILAKRHALQHVHIMILDDLTVPADLVHEIIDTTNVRILSVRGAKQLNHTKLTQLLKYAVRPSRPAGTPRLRGLYVFGPSAHIRSKWRSPPSSTANSPYHGGVTASEGAQIGATWNQKSHDLLASSLSGCNDVWYQCSKKRVTESQAVEELWGETLQACEGIIAFDGVLCRGPRHVVEQEPSDNKSWLRPMLANIALGPHGCAECKSSVEGCARYGRSPVNHLPLLDPPPLHSSLVSDAQRPNLTANSEYPRLFVRCEPCMVGRRCERCFRWWDEKCYPSDTARRRTSEVREAAMVLDPATQSSKQDIRVFLGLCTGSCLVSEEMYGSGSGGMWG